MSTEQEKPAGAQAEAPDFKAAWLAASEQAQKAIRQMADERIQRKAQDEEIARLIECAFNANARADVQAEEIARLRAEAQRLAVDHAYVQGVFLDAGVEVGPDLGEAARAVADLLSEAQQRIETLTRLAREVLIWLPVNLPSNELYGAVDNLSTAVQPPQEEDQP